MSAMQSVPMVTKPTGTPRPSKQADAVSRESLRAIADALLVIGHAAGVPPKHAEFARLMTERHARPPLDLVGACRKVVAASRGRLSPQLAAMAMGEPAPLAVTAQPEAALPARRRPGPKPIGEQAMSPAERNRKWRAKASLVTLEVPEHLALMVRELRDQRGMSTGELLTAALAALARQVGGPGDTAV